MYVLTRNDTKTRRASPHRSWSSNHCKPRCGTLQYIGGKFSRGCIATSLLPRYPLTSLCPLLPRVPDMGRNNNHSYRVIGKQPGEDMPYTRQGKHAIACNVCNRVSRTYSVYQTVCRRPHKEHGLLVHINEPMPAGTDGVMDELVERRLVQGRGTLARPLLPVTDLFEGDALAFNSPSPTLGDGGSHLDEDIEQVGDK